MVYLTMHVYSDQFRSGIMEMRTAGLHRIVDTKRYRIHLFSLVACRDLRAIGRYIYEKKHSRIREKSEITANKLKESIIGNMLRFHIRA